MKKYLILSFMMLFCLGNVLAQQKCPRCHGNKKVRTRFALASYGIDTSKIKCKYCGKWVFKSDEHWDVCPDCNGSGLRTIKRTLSEKERDKKKESSNNELRAWMTASEALAYDNLLRQLMRGTTSKTVTCSACNGSGLCRGCKGTGSYAGQGFYGSFQATCPVCCGLRTCSSCAGQKWTVQEVPLTEQEKNFIIERIKEITSDATKRMKGQ